ncbi:trigger factor [Candidatus Rhabdochlamydia porcellionis]|jgi:trigger factor|uniref:Trigger factor n=1 Tax=Candidatus Rhabdochlamydia porcellionis TaxID=225148 RepID=A0ABX8Z0J9_9BACT|nr:trigger factor [Candidatus Rhabdochlamydia porcellionis]QZA59200.1 Trigger factor [Candidatus Rhabdochlamydia porcellionis]
MDQATTEPRQLVNEHVRFTIHNKPSCIVEFDVEALKPLIQTAHKKAVKKIGKSATLPRFRKGKAPDNLIEKNFPDEIKKQWDQEIANAAFQECQKLANISILHKEAKVSYSIKSHSSHGALLTLSFETEPTLPFIDPKEIQLKSVKKPEVTPEKIAETIRQTQFFFAKWEKITDRPVQENDFVTLDVDLVEEGTPLFSNTRFEVNAKGMAEWMLLLVLGKNISDIAEGVSVPDQNASQEEKEKLKPKKARITIKSIDLATLPPIDEKFAKLLGVSSVEELHQRVEELLNKQADAHVQEALREQVTEILLKQFSFDLPATLIQKEVEFRIQQLAQNADFKSYWDNLKTEERKKIFETIQQQSEKAVRMFYLCRKIIDEANIRIAAEDVPSSASIPLEILLNPQNPNHSNHPEIEHAEAYSRLILEKAEDWIIKYAKF